MNIVTPIPTTVVFTTANVNTESARRDNQLRETVPQLTQPDSSAAESGLGSESDRVKTPGQQQPVVYERPQPQQNQAGGERGDALGRDNADDPSAGKENAESRQQEQQEQAEQREIEELKARDQEVRTHEQAHANTGGQHAGSPSYEFETGPDGQQYAVGGEVSIDISPEKTPEATIRKMQQVRSAALAPAEPSPQDLRVASEATQIATEARAEISQERADRAQSRFKEAFPPESPVNQAAEPIAGTERQSAGPELDEIVDGIGTVSPTRRLSEDPVAEAVGLETRREEFRRLRETRDDTILRRVSVIESFYQQVTVPREAGLQQSA